MLNNQDMVLLARSLTEVLEIVLLSYDQDIPVNEGTIATLRNIVSDAKEILAE